MLSMSQKGKLNVRNCYEQTRKRDCATLQSYGASASCVLCTILVVPPQKEYRATCKNKGDDKDLL